MDTGGRWSTVTGVSTFGVGLICATFQTCGKYSFEIQLLMIAVIGPTKCSAASFTNRAGSWSGPVEQSVLSCLRVFRTSLCVTFLKWKASSYMSDRPRISWKNSSTEVDSTPSVLFAVEAKWRLSLSGSNLRGDKDWVQGKPYVRLL